MIAQSRKTAHLPALFAVGLFAFQSWRFLRSSLYFVDDPFISMRYAGNLLVHGELSFNPGQRVEGYSNLLHVLLHALTFKLRGGVPDAVSGLDLAALVVFGCTLLQLALLGFLARRDDGEGRASAWHFAFLLTAASWPVAFWASAGLETPIEGLLYVALLAVVTSLAARPARLSGLVALLIVLLFALTLLRFEGVIVALAVAAALAICLLRAQRRTAALVLLGSTGALGAAYHLWRLSYFGHLLPNTFVAKATGGSLPGQLIAGASYCGGWLALLAGGVTLVALALAALDRAGLSLSWKLADAPVELVAATVIAIKLALVTWGGGDWMPGYRMLVPITPLALYLMMRLLLPAIGKPPPQLAGWPALLLGVALLLSSRPGPGYFPAIDRIPNEAGNLKKLPLGYLLVGQLLERGFKDGSEEVAIGEAGLVPFEAFHVRFLDLFGLVDEDMARQPGGLHRRVHVAHLLERHPAAVVFAHLHLMPPYGKYQYGEELLPSPAFHKAYRLAEIGPVLQALGWAIYLRRDLSPEARALSWATSDPRLLALAAEPR